MIEVAVLKFIISEGGDRFLPYLSPMMFSGDIPKHMMEIVKTHHRRHNCTPTMDDIKVNLYRKFEEPEDKKRVRRYLRNLKNMELSSEATQDLINDIIQKSKLRGFFQTYIPQIDSLESVNFDEMRVEIEKIGNLSGISNDENKQSLLTMPRRYRDRGNAIPTFSDKINYYLDPGISPGELGIIQANPGIGKTLLAINLTTAAARAGFRPWFITLDEAGEDISSRFDDHINNFMKKGKMPSWVSLIEIVDFSDGKKVADLDLLLERAEAKPHLLVIDGTDDFIDTSSKEVRHQIGNIYKELRRLTRNKHRPVAAWLTTQSTAASEKKLKKGIFDVGENKVVKAAEASHMISVNQTEEEFEAKMARLFIAKMRRKKGKWKTAKVYYNEESQMLKDLNEDAEEENFIKQSLDTGRSKKKKKK